MQATGEPKMDVDAASVITSASSSRLHLEDGHPQRRASSVPARRPRASDFQVGYVYDSKMLMHSCLHGHPEQPARIKGVHDTLNTANLLTKMKKLPIRMAERDEVLLVHSEHLWDKVMAISSKFDDVNKTNN